jgi:hypothetical protein
MYVILIFNFLIYSISSFAQSPISNLSNKLRPLTYQAERILAQDLKNSLEEAFIGERISININLETSAQKLASIAGISSKKLKFDLPGLDESTINLSQNSKNYEPNINDVYLSATKFSAIIGIFREWNDEEKQRAKEIINNKVRTLNIATIDINFELKAPQNPLVKNLSENVSVVENKIPDNLLYTIGGSILISAVFISLLIYFFFQLGFKKIETLSQSFGTRMGEALQTFSPASLPQAPAPTNANRLEPITQHKENTETYDEIKLKISQFLKSQQTHLNALFEYIDSLSDPKILYIFLDSLPDSERDQWKNKISDKLKQDYRDFLVFLTEENNDMGSYLKNFAHTLYRDLNLFSHDPELLKKQSLKSKVSKLDRMSLAQVIELSDEREFGFLAQVTDPVQLSSVLSSYPHLLKKFNKIPKVTLSIKEMELFSKRINDQLLNQKESVHDQLSLSSFLPPELEAELNQKMGITQSSFDLLTENQKSAMLPFALSLPLPQLAAFLPILPEQYKNFIIDNLPDIKRQQVMRKALSITDESFKLKNKFLTQVMSSSSV